MRPRCVDTRLLTDPEEATSAKRARRIVRNWPNVMASPPGSDPAPRPPHRVVGRELFAGARPELAPLAVGPEALDADAALGAADREPPSHRERLRGREAVGERIGAGLAHLAVDVELRRDRHEHHVAAVYQYFLGRIGGVAEQGLHAHRVALGGALGRALDDRHGARAALGDV